MGTGCFHHTEITADPASGLTEGDGCDRITIVHMHNIDSIRRDEKCREEKNAGESVFFQRQGCLNPENPPDRGFC